MVVRGDNEQSEHWDERHDLPLLQSGFHDCWPCREGFPVFPWHSKNRTEALFEIVTAWGHRTEAWIDDTREFMAEGLEWIIQEGNRTRNVEAIQVACWRRIPSRSTPRSRG
ncbi:MAG TPA: hypothetical protein VFT59_01485 [Candidatus Saccharimonadales bacterium]|nr:hypothetical protein [Candidatus Saccharimonadales bacterium]